MECGRGQRKLLSGGRPRPLKSPIEMGPGRGTVASVNVPAAPRSRGLVPAAAAFLAVVAGFSALLLSSRPYAWSGPASEEPYNLMVGGFRSGHAWLAKEAPPGLVAAADPYAFSAYRRYLGAPWGLTDLSYFRGHLYAYFGATPAVILLWPYRALTGQYLHQAVAVFIFCVLGYAVAAGLGIAVWRRYFPGVGPWAGAAAALLMGSVTTLPVFLVRPGLFEVSISCGFALVMLSLAALWNSWHRPARRCAWLAAASLAYGLAVGARPSLLFGAAVLFLPAAAAIREGSRGAWRPLLAALLPISAVGAGLAAYNLARFGDPLQTGHAYQLTGYDVSTYSSFGPQYLWGNVRLYFLEPLRWHGDFPFVWEPVTPPLPPGHYPVEFFFGTLAALPVLFFAALVPLAWMGGRGPGGARRGLPWACAALLTLFLAAAVPLCLYAGATIRYQLDFMPPLALLALLGLLGLERMLGGAVDPGRASLSPVQSAMAGSPFSLPLRGAAACALAFSVAVVWLLAIALSSFYRGADRGMAELFSGRIAEGVAVYNRVCRINPDFRGKAEMTIGAALVAHGRQDEGITYLESAVRDEPLLEQAHVNLGRTYLVKGRLREAADSLGEAAVLDPLDAEVQADLGVALFKEGRIDSAIVHEEAALRLDPTLSIARSNLQAFEAAANAAP
jgi:tetratricopeptide (TPR) repeat protein